MPENIIIAVISLAGSLCGTFGGILVSNRLTNYRIEQLEKKVEKHNQVVERTYKLEQDVAVLNNRESVSEHRINDLEKEV